MKHGIVIGLLALSACTGSTGSNPLNTPWLGANPSAAVSVGGSAANTTNAFDGTYIGVSITTAGSGQSGPKTGPGTTRAPTCQNYDKPPTLTVTNGLAQFEALGVIFAGYVTPQGHLTMHSGYGATVIGQAKPALVDEDFDGDFDAQTHVLHGRVLGGCSYDVRWQRVA